MCQSTNLTCPTCHLLRSILIPCDPRLRTPTAQRSCRDLKHLHMPSPCQKCNVEYNAAYARTAGDADARRELVRRRESGAGWQRYVEEDVRRACSLYGVHGDEVLYA